MFLAVVQQKTEIIIIIVPPLVRVLWRVKNLVRSRILAREETAENSFQHTEDCCDLIASWSMELLDAQSLLSVHLSTLF